MSHTQYVVKGAIDRSSQYDEIVTVIVEDIKAAFTALTADQDDYDYVDTRGEYGEPLREVWDTSHDDDSSDWRVHLQQ